MDFVQRRVNGFFTYVRVVGLRQAMLLYFGRIFRFPAEIDLMWDELSSPITCRPAGSDFYVLRHVFVDRDGDLPLPVKPRLIIDGGANVGYASVLYANKYPDARIIAVEPDGDNCRRYRQNCAAYSNVDLVRGGIWSRRAHLRICNPEAEPWAFEVVEADEPGPGTIEAFTIADLLERSGEEFIDILKLDIEGSETAVFSSPDIAWVDRTRVLSIEVHGEAAEAAVLSAFASRDFAFDRKGEKLIFTNNRLASVPSGIGVARG